MTKENNVINEKINKKNNSWIRFFLAVFVILGLGYIVLNYVPFIAKYDHYVIVTGSMKPIIMTGDVVIIDSSVKAGDIEPGQIIAFLVDLNEDGTKEVIVHYLYSVTNVDGVDIYNTKPEVSNDIDQWDLRAEDILGVHVLTVPKIGPLLLFAQSTVGKVVLVVDVIILYLLAELFSGSKKNKQHKEISKLDKPEDESVE